MWSIPSLFHSAGKGDSIKYWLSCCQMSPSCQKTDKLFYCSVLSFEHWGFKAPVLLSCIFSKATCDFVLCAPQLCFREDLMSRKRIDPWSELWKLILWKESGDCHKLAILHALRSTDAFCISFRFYSIQLCNTGPKMVVCGNVLANSTAVAKLLLILAHFLLCLPVQWQLDFKLV